MFPNRDQRTSHGLRRYTAAPGPLLDEPTVLVGTRSCDRKTSGPTVVAEPAAPPAGPSDPAHKECRVCASLLRPAFQFLPAVRVSVRRSRSTVVPESLASAVADSRGVPRRSFRQFPDYLCWPSPVVMLASGFPAHILPP